MTKQEQIQEEINNIVENNPYHHSKQYKIAKWQEVKLQELGILDMMPNAPYRAGYIGHSDAKAVIEAAEDTGKQTGGFSDGEGWEHTSKPSKLNQLLNSEDEKEETVKAEITTVRATDCHKRNTGSKYVQPAARKTIDDAIAQYMANTSDSQNAAATCYFNWYEDSKTWCLSGETRGRVSWETEDFEADTQEQAEQAAIEYLEWDYDYYDDYD
jgi:hypothetical protein